MLAILTLLFAAMADERLEIPEHLGPHLDSLLGHAGISIDQGQLSDRDGVLGQPTQDIVLRWVVQRRGEWLSHDPIDVDRPRSMLYRMRGLQLAPIVDWIKQTGTDPGGRSWYDTYRSAMRHRFRAPTLPGSMALLGPAGTGVVAYRFLYERPLRPASRIEGWVEGEKRIYDGHFADWTVQYLPTKELIEREIAVMDPADLRSSRRRAGGTRYMVTPSDTRWFSLRDRSGRPLLTFWLESAESTPFEFPLVIARGWGDREISELISTGDLESLEPVLRLGAEFLLYLQPNTDRWDEDTLPLLLFPWEQQPLHRLVDKHKTEIFNPRGSVRYDALFRALVRELTHEGTLAPPILESWYEATTAGPAPELPYRVYGQKLDHAKLPLPRDVAQMQFDRTVWNKSHQLLGAFHELNFEYDDESDFYKQFVYEARFTDDPESVKRGRGVGGQVIQAALWWEGQDADGQWVGIIRKAAPEDQLVQLVDKHGFIEGGGFFDFSRGTGLHFAYQAHDLAHLLEALKHAWERLLHGQYDLFSSQLAPMDYRPGPMVENPYGPGYLNPSIWIGPQQSAS
jgi:hypothetical protein